MSATFRHLPRFAACSRKTANGRPVSQLRYFSETQASAIRPQPPSDGFKGAGLQFKRKSDAAAALDGITAPSMGVREKDAFYSETMISPLKHKRSEQATLETRRLVDALESKNAQEAYEQVRNLYDEEMTYLKSLSRQQLSQLFVLLAKSTKSAEENWKRAELLFTCMDKMGHQLMPKEISILLQTASRARLLDAVQGIWEAVIRSGAKLNIDCWNSYLRATCNADDTMWHVKFNGFQRRPEPAVLNDPVKIVSQIYEDGLTPNAKTFELVVMALGRAGNLEYASAVAASVWGIKLDNAPLAEEEEMLEDDENPVSPVKPGSVTTPSVDTLVALVNAYGSQGQLVEGLKLMEKMHSLYQISITSDRALPLWEAVLKWAYYSSEPWGPTPSVALDAIWTSIVDRHKIAPSGRMVYYKAHRLLALRDYMGMVDLVPLVLASRNIANKEQQASSILYKATKGLVNSGQYSACEQVLDTWGNKGGHFERVREKTEMLMVNGPSSRKRWSPEVLPLEDLGMGAVRKAQQQEQEQEQPQETATTSHKKASRAQVAYQQYDVSLA